MPRRKKEPAASGDNLRERAYVHIQRKIAAGELKPGGSVNEVLLAKELKSSRTPVREAIGQLVVEGLLDQRPNRGAIVVEPKRQDINDLYELREALEVYAVEKASRRNVNPDALKELQALADEILTLKNELDASGAAALDAAQMQRFIRCDMGFHTQLMQIAANPRILKIVADTRLLIRVFTFHRRGHYASELTRIHAQHCDVLRAVAAQDSECARKLLSSHIDSSRCELLEQYDRWERDATSRKQQPLFFDLRSAPFASQP